VKYAFIQRHEVKYPIGTMCRVLRASRSGYYQWRKGRVPQHIIRQQELLEKIKKIFQDSRGNYGSPRVLRELRKEGIVVNHKTVEELMKKNGIKAKTKKKFKATTDSKHNLPIAPNLLNREFGATRPNQAWVGDITYIATEEGWLYLATWIDLWSRKIVGWSMAPRMTADLVVNAFRLALFRQKRQAPELIHSDRGSQYASEIFRGEIQKHGCKQSMSRKGNCWGRVNNWRGFLRAWGVSVFRLLSLLPGVSIQFMIPFPVAARQTGRAHLAHPAFTCNFKPSLSANRRVLAVVYKDRVSHRDTRLDIGDIQCLSVRFFAPTIAVSAFRCIA